MFLPRQRGGRRGRGDRGEQRGRGGRGGRGRQICRSFQQGRCRFGANCSYSHELPNNAGERPEETPEQQQSKADYNSWKRLIKSLPQSNDNRTIKSLWNGALTILDGDDRDWKQMLPRDLDDEEYHGRAHIQVLMGMEPRAHGHSTFVTLARPFLLVITHQALLDCLSVDTAVGGLYNFISGSNGTRAIPFFQRLSSSLERSLELATSGLTATLETTLIAMLRALRELLRREQRAAFHDDLPGLIDSTERLSGGIDAQSMAFQILRNSIAELHGARDRATGRTQQNEEPHVDGVSTTFVTSTYPRETVLPQDRHDNDKTDITKIRILPTEDEIRSDHAVFLPSTDRDQPHFLLDQVQRHHDTHFRLLRHDVLGETSEVIGRTMVALEADPTFVQNPKLSLGNTRAYVYFQSHISYVSFDRRRGLEAQISFLQPPSLRKESSSVKRRWWEETRRLEEGVLVAFLSVHDVKSSLLFFTVSQKCTDPSKGFGLSSHGHLATITAELATQDQNDLEKLVQLSCSRTKGILVEFPGVLPATFVPILESIQSMQRLSRLPFRQWILPDRVASSSDGSIVVDVPPPLYTRSPGFAFSLQPILKNAGDIFSIDPRSLPDDIHIINKLVRRTNLDRGQCQALVAALTREFALIQGPPGTGKSYLGVQLMRVLLACKSKAKLGPVVVVCYTNHALDQFLEHLIEVGIEKIIRIGGQSKSAILEGKNLRVVSKSISKTKSENYDVAMAIKTQERQEKSIKSILSTLHGSQKRRDWASLKAHLSKVHPRIYRQFDRVDEAGFTLVGDNPFDNWARAMNEHQPVGVSTESIDRLLAEATVNVYSVSASNRRRLVTYWVESIRDEMSNRLSDEVKAVHMSQQRLRNVYDEVDRRVLQTADVIGVTTSGLAKRIPVLRHVTSKIVICEEAGEVMEPHMLSALLPSVEHFIQIGDHQQLRPQINNFNLSLESHQGLAYQLDRSQFERLSTGERGRPTFPVAQLNVQRRMRPQISTLISSLYPLLLDHDSTKNLPDVLGMRKNVFWLDHDNFEEGAQADLQQRSHSNLWEVDMTHALVRHIVRQGIYSSTDIAVLTPYTGQLQKLRVKLQNDFEIVLSERDQETLMKEGFHSEESSPETDQTGNQLNTGTRPLEKKKMSELLRIATVDNFQGEEAKVVIVSLVRSNKERKVGFLKTTNRINVLLSRAQHGMYLIGNTDTYSNIPMWAQVRDLLQGADSVGGALGLCCPRHKETDIQVAQPEDFTRLSPEGGCQLACDRRANCGHRCSARCHSDSMHQVFSCPQPCERLHTPCQHSCQKQTCGEDCGACLVKIDDVQLLCGHTMDKVHCYRTQDLNQIRCPVPVPKIVPKCDHTVEVACFHDVASEHFKCPTPCNAMLACGHFCSGTCSSCKKRGDSDQIAVKHLPCSKTCRRKSGACNHTCPRPCHNGKECGPCLLPCDVRCAHSKCTLRCHQPCAPCVEKCTWSCEHDRGDCGMPCAAPCSRLPCNKRCTRKLSCAHQCPGICGEECPEGYCQSCSDRQDARVDLLEMKTYGAIDLDETPILVLGCGHFFTAETLDRHMGMAEVYLRNGYDEFTGVRDASATLAQSIPRCPDCQCPVRQHCTKRFNRVINRAVIDEMSKRFLVNGQVALRDVENQVVDMELELTSSREDIIKALRQTTAPRSGQLNVTKQLKERDVKAKKVEKTIQNFLRNVADKHQPAQKLHDATVSAMRRRPADEMLADLSFADLIPTVARDRRITLGGRAAQLKAGSIILDDRLLISEVLKSTSAKGPTAFPARALEKQAKTFLSDYSAFIDNCEAKNLPKLAVEASLHYAGTTRAYQCYCRASNADDIQFASQQVASAKAMLEKAKGSCLLGFQNANALLKAVEEALRFLGREWYEKVTVEEITAIKEAMVSAGSSGIMTHSGHWYNCVNGHPVSCVLYSSHFPRHYILSLGDCSSYGDLLLCCYRLTK